MPQKLQQNKSQNYEGKWDKIVMKMLRAEVAKNPATGADLAKGFDFYFHAAMEFAKQLEHEFQIAYAENEKRTPSSHHLKATISSLAKSVERSQPIFVPKKQMPNKVSEMIDGFEQKKYIQSISEENNITKSLYNAPFFDSAVDNSITTKRPSLQLDSTKIPKQMKALSANSTPTETEISKSVAQESHFKSEITEETNKRNIETEPEPELILFNDNRMITKEIFPKVQEKQTPVLQSSAETETIFKALPEPNKKAIIPATKVELPKPFITEIPKPTPFIPEPPKFEPPRQRVRVGAICNDGWRSSSTGRGTCSGHGGVREWLYSEY